MAIIKGEAVVPSIDTELAAIDSAVYGEEVRGSIHNALYKTHKVVKDYSYPLVDTVDVTGAAIESKTVGTLLQTVSARIDKLEYVPVEIERFNVLIPSRSMKGNSFTTVGLDLQLSEEVDTVGVVLRRGLTDTPLISESDITSIYQMYDVPGDPISSIFSIVVNIKPNPYGLYVPDIISDERRIDFHNAIYIDQEPEPAEINDAFLQSMDYGLSNTRSRSFTLNIEEGNYGWYAIPASLGTPRFKVGGFDGGFRKVATFNHTNIYGFAEDYQVWRTDNPSLGSCTVVVS